MEPEGELTPGMVQDLLVLVTEGEVSLAIIGKWTPNELAIAYDWAMREHLHASDNHSVRTRPQPWLITIALMLSRMGEHARDALASAYASPAAPGGTVAERNATLQRSVTKSWDSE
jgi:hypothetical protein